MHKTALQLALSVLLLAGVQAHAGDTELFTPSKALTYYANGTYPRSINDVSGWWIMVGQVNVDANAAKFTAQPDLFDANGLYNQDGSRASSLYLSNLTQQDFEGHIINTPSFGLYDVGSRGVNEGPHALTFADNITSMMFFQNAYDQDDKVLKSNFSYRCRLLANRTDRLICAVVYILDPSEKASAGPLEKQLAGKVIQYVGYTRAQSGQPN